ncbi:MAG TPA: phenylalanine--tRNA ligase subunit beta [Pirellulales bacterium]|jgi:phenylalanyl-tRNA synthetase beta chain|nr:phenylalanine--tRNA ligase subunit beta [Pirellulales bacterium]
MLVSWDWLQQYVQLDMTPEQLSERLMMAGLNHEATERHGADWAINLEVTSNRPDCLGHIGIAREISVLWNRALKLPPADPREGRTPVTGLTQVALDAPELCYRYTARVIRGLKVGPSPAWLVNRLATIGIAAINNVVDVTNYVLMECGQPLHAFDLAGLHGRRIVVRRARPGETFLAINHKTYTLDPGMCVIADADRAVGLGGVMGGAETEVSARTADVLIEAAEFDPMSIRTTARKLSLHSDSSYRFERGLDPEGVAWASRRCCELILELAGGDLAEGAIDVGQKPLPREAITLRYAQIERILGIDVPAPATRQILTALGNRELRAEPDLVEVIPPFWRRDLAREIDLVEEVARIHGYDKIPEDASVPMVPSHRTRQDRVLARVRHVLCAAGFDEALTLSVVDENWSEAFSPWTAAPALSASMPVLRRADRLRRSLVPSLLGARRTNEALANADVELFETAKVYLPMSGSLPEEDLMLALTSGRDFLAVKGVIEGVAAALNRRARISVRPTRHELLDAASSGQLWLEVPGSPEQLLGYVGEVSPAGLKRFELRAGTTVAELRLAVLIATADLVPQQSPLSVFPAVARDLNLEMSDTVAWADVEQTVRQAAGDHLETLEFCEDYRNPKQVAAGHKRLLFRFALRSHADTLTNQQADEIRDRIVAACQTRHGAKLLT